jgi:hypothetical protein
MPHEDDMYHGKEALSKLPTVGQGPVKKVLSRPSNYSNLGLLQTIHPYIPIPLEVWAPDCS